MELLISVLVILGGYLLVGYWERKAQKEKQRKDWVPKAWRDKSSLLVISISLFASCTSARFVPTGTQQAKMCRVQWQDHGRALLTLVTAKGDSVYFNDRSPSMQRRRYIIGDWYTIQYDSSTYQLIDGKKSFQALLKHNL